MSLPPPRTVGIRAVKDNFSALLNEVAAGDHVLVCRRSKPLAALIPLADLDRLGDLVLRDEELAALLGRLGHRVEPWSTARLIEVIVSHLSRAGAAEERPADRGAGRIRSGSAPLEPHHLGAGARIDLDASTARVPLPDRPRGDDT